MALTKLTTVGRSASTEIGSLKDVNGTKRVEANTSGAVVTGILTATSFDGVSESDIPLASSSKFYEIDDVLNVSEDTTLTRASGNPGTIYVKHQQVEVANTKSLIIGNGEELVIDTYQF